MNNHVVVRSINCPTADVNESLSFYFSASCYNRRNAEYVHDGAGGRKGERLQPLTEHRAKPAVPFGGKYRIIDFTLSNCLNSGLRKSPS